ncbi:IclR family transcriptional regulator C-terminal domain-containing protein [soil metagenome]
MRQSENPDFVEALARGLDVIRAMGGADRALSLADVAERSGLARPTARRILITLTELGYVRSADARFALTARVLELGMAYIQSSNVWELTRPHLASLAEATSESCSIAQLDGSDIVYVSRVAVPKLVTLSVVIGTRFPAVQTSLGKVLLAALDDEELDRVLQIPSRSAIAASWQPGVDEIRSVLAQVRQQGWALTDQQLAPAIRSIAAPVRDSAGAVVASVNVNANATQTPIRELVERFLPQLLECAAAISRDWALWESRPVVELGSAASTSA